MKINMDGRGWRKMLYIFIFMRMYKQYNKLKSLKWDDIKKQHKEDQKSNYFYVTENNYDAIIKNLKQIMMICIVFSPYNSTCLIRSTVYYTTCRYLGVPVDFVIGFSNGIHWGMHCWIELEGTVIYDSPKNSRLYIKSNIKLIDKGTLVTK